MVADVAREIVVARGRAVKWSRAFEVHAEISLPPQLFDVGAPPVVEKDYLPRGFALSDAVGKGGAEKRRASGSAAGGGGRASEGGGGVSAEKKPRPSSAGKGEAKGGRPQEELKLDEELLPSARDDLSAATPFAADNGPELTPFPPFRGYHDEEAMQGRVSKRNPKRRRNLARARITHCRKKT